WHIGDNYFTRVRGFIKPQATGNYAFNVTGDDHTELFLSTTTSTAQMRRIAFIQGWTNETEYHKYPSQTATNIALEAGKVYYFELRHKEGGGGDGWRISWNTSNATNNWQPIQSQFLARACNNTFQAAQSRDIFAFIAKADYNNAKLEWVSNTGFRDDFYEVQRAGEDENFETIARVNVKSDKNESLAYNFTDFSPLEGENNYRIKTIRLDGMTPQYSAIEKLNFKAVGDIKVFPNPATDHLDMDLSIYSGKPVTIIVYNVVGKPVQTLKIEAASTQLQRLDAQNLTSGTYLIRVQTAGKRDVLKQIKVVR
ncbi:MAG: T9SS type A sorting domain-containing protein, partial [Saprospiraceae bacterium]|nr:T9SS type A sorting domain-containing protein [Saprospiraceae bacterium]